MLRSCPSRAAFGWSYAIGVAFFLGSMWWLIHVTVAGWLILCAYLGLFFGAFGWAVGRLTGPEVNAPSEHAYAAHGASVWVLPAAWVSLEFARSHALSGFGWNLLGYSQAPWLDAIQLAEFTGAWGVSFLVMLVNVALAGAAAKDRPLGGRLRSLALAALVLALAAGLGRWRTASAAANAPREPLRVAVVQGNIPQDEKWDERFQERILEQYERLTAEVLPARPDLIVWPETSVPGYLGVEAELTARVTAIARGAGRPLLAGAPTLDVRQTALRNSAVLIAPDGTLRARYDKLHLVPFGEFVPFERHVPWLRALLPPIGTFVPGTAPTVFRLDEAPAGSPARSGVASPRAFGALICFEDVFPEIARRLVREGAEFLVVITNDAWFGPTGAAYQHAQASTFRAVELRAPVVRAANTGWSGCISPTGAWGPRVREGGRELFVAGTAVCDVSRRAARTLYLAWGDWFALGCLMLAGGWMLLELGMARRQQGR